jgi:hypothetical protein
VLILVTAVQNDVEVRQLALLEEFKIRPSLEYPCEVEIDWKKLFAAPRPARSGANARTAPQPELEKVVTLK